MSTSDDDSDIDQMSTTPVDCRQQLRELSVWNFLRTYVGFVPADIKHLCLLYAEIGEEFDEIRSSTQIVIENISVDIPRKKIKSFMLNKGNFSSNQIETVNIVNSRKRNIKCRYYALVTFRKDVKYSKISKFMRKINESNAKYVSEKPIKRKGNQLNQAWKRKIVLHFRKGMNQNEKNRVLIVRNFHILNFDIFEDLTELFAAFGDLYKNIQIDLDETDEPFAIVTFRYIEDAVYCCKSVVEFRGRTLIVIYASHQFHS
eukprot:502616_1